MKPKKDKYSEIIQNMKDEKMDWDFEDFLKKAEKMPPEENEAHSGVKAGFRLPVLFWLAASVVLIASVLFLLQYQKNVSQFNQDALVKKEILQQKSDDSLNFYVKNQPAVADSTALEERDSVVYNRSVEKEAEQVMDRILPKRGRIRKSPRQRFVSNETPSKTVNQDKSILKPEYHDDFVIINGHKIESEKEAIDVTRYSLQMFSEKVSQTIATTEPVTEIVDF